jgi:hypothetical protein
MPNLVNVLIHQDQQYYNPSRTVLDPPSYEVSILFEGSTLTSKPSPILRLQLHTAPLINTICKAKKCFLEVSQKIDWPAFGRPSFPAHDTVEFVLAS